MKTRTKQDRRQLLSRRAFLHFAGATGVLAGSPHVMDWARVASASPSGVSRWSDPATWGGSPPGPSTVATISSPVLLDVDATVGGIDIAPGGVLMFDPDTSRSLTSSGNVVVRGTLQMKPSSHSVFHTISFTGINESAFVGGGMEVVASDKGLWVMEAGRLDIAGAPKLAWTRVTGAIAKGARTITLVADPEGWVVGDELTIAPTLPPTAANHSTAYDTATITGIVDRTISLSQTTVYDHPAVTVKQDSVMTAEVLNLTRNVRIEGTPAGRAHVFIRSTSPQSVAHAALRFVGPRKTSGGVPTSVLGRYGLHFHMSADGSRGSVIDGVVVRDAGGHAFVPHMSHGVTFRDCIAHSTFDDAYWWDLPDSTHDTLFDGCVASFVQSVFRTDGFYTLTGFSLNSGLGNAAIGCLAVGMQATKNASGFNWPSQANGNDGVWLFEDCVAHNGRANAVYVWQNTSNVHVVSRFTAYHNGGFGLRHGAYRNPYRYEDSTLYGNLLGSMELIALSKANGPMTFSNVVFDQTGLSPYCVQTGYHIQPAQAPVLFTGCQFKGHKNAALAFLTRGGSAEVVDVVDCTFSGNEFWLASTIPPSSIVRVKDAAHGSIALRRYDQPGTMSSKWNARVSPIKF